MSSFTEPLVFTGTDEFRGGRLRPLRMSGEEFVALTRARRLVEIGKTFSYDCPRTKRVYTIKAGFRCDLGSIPGLARAVLSPDDPWAQAFVLHDFLYRHGRELGVDRRTADLILRDALALPFRVYREGDPEPLRAVCPALFRGAIYYSVRVGGGLAFT